MTTTRAALLKLTLATAVVASLGGPSAAQSVLASLGPTREIQCANYADIALENASYIAQNCELQGGRYSAYHEDHLSWCLQEQDENLVMREHKARLYVLDACKTCQGYVQKTEEQFSRAMSCQTPVSGAYWVPNPWRVHLNWCLSSHDVFGETPGVNATVAPYEHFYARQRELMECGAPPPSTSP